MSQLSILPVRLAEREYDIVIGDHLLTNGVAVERLLSLRQSEPIVFVTHPALLLRYVTPLVTSLEKEGVRCHTLVYPPGEHRKTLAGMMKIYSGFAQAGVDRKGLVVVVGGGVLGDMVGFAAATFMRGVRFVQIPTTLLAQVDASVGGKTAVDLPEGKNLVGAFYQPSAVLIDPQTLNSLPLRELRSGLAEVIKYGIIWDKSFFERLRFLRKSLLSRDTEALGEIIRVCCESKAEVVKQDETEQNVRAILNFGHTVGHAIEAATHYKVYKHGEAIAIGMVSEALIGEKLGITPMTVTAEIEAALSEFGLPTRFPKSLPQTEFFDAMMQDKKTVFGEFKFVLAEEVGRVLYGQTVSREVIERSLFD